MTFVLSLGLIAADCGSIPVEPLAANERLGVISVEDQPTVIEVPEVVEVGKDVAITVGTYGVGGECVTMGRTRISESGSLVIIEPIDSVVELPPDAICTAALYLFRHETSLVFSEAGSVVVEIRGREWPKDEVIRIRRRVLVQ